VSIVLIPKRNEKDLVDVPEDVRSQLRIIPVETMDQVLAEALIDAPRPAARIKAERAARQKRVAPPSGRAPRSTRRSPDKPVLPIPGGEAPVDQPPAGTA